MSVGAGTNPGKDSQASISRSTGNPRLQAKLPGLTTLLALLRLADLLVQLRHLGRVPRSLRLSPLTPQPLNVTRALCHNNLQVRMDRSPTTYPRSPSFHFFFGGMTFFGDGVLAGWLGGWLGGGVLGLDGGPPFLPSMINLP